MANIYDIYVFTKCRTSPIIQETAISGLDVVLLRKKLLNVQNEFLNIDISQSFAAILNTAIVQAQGYALPVPTNYRQPHYPLEHARAIALQYIQELNVRTQIKYDIPLFRAEHPLWWKFFSVAPELLDKGVVPGGHFIRVDKLDGHIWTPQAEFAYRLQFIDTDRWPSLRVFDYYDVFLPIPCPTLPILATNSPAFPYISNPTVQGRLQQKRPGLVAFDLPLQIAVAFLDAVDNAGGWAALIPATYRQPRITVVEASYIAAETLKQRIAHEYPHSSFEDITQSGESPFGWVFRANYTASTDRQPIPPRMLVIEVDKLDGHIWTETEHTIYSEIFGSNGISRLDRT